MTSSFRFSPISPYTKVWIEPYSENPNRIMCNICFEEYAIDRLNTQYENERILKVKLVLGYKLLKKLKSEIDKEMKRMEIVVKKYW